MTATKRHGKICYVEVPAKDVATSSAFYAAVFGWQLRTRGDGAVAFDDANGSVSGAFTGIVAPGAPGSPPMTAVSLVVYIMVDDLARTIAAITERGCEVLPGRYDDGRAARFRDPAGNILGIYEERQASA
jgi:predicted enzyme related to lactoylglutathione lyase